MKDRIRWQVRRGIQVQSAYFLAPIALLGVLFVLDFNTEGMWGILFMLVLFVALAVFMVLQEARIFRRMIGRQEEITGRPFSDENAVYLGKYSLCGYNDEWFILSGYLAFHIRAVANVRFSDRISRFRITVSTEDGKDFRFYLRRLEAEAFFEWSGYFPDVR